MKKRMWLLQACASLERGRGVRGGFSPPGGYLGAGHAALVGPVHEWADGQTQLSLLVTLHTTIHCRVSFPDVHVKP